MIFEQVDGGLRLTIDDNSREVVTHLLGELRGEIASAKHAGHADLAPHMKRLFPAAYHDDEKRNDEYRRLTHDDLADAHVRAIDDAVTMLAPGRVFHSGEIERFVRAINALRLVLGTVLDVSEDGEDEAETVEDDKGDDHTTLQRQIYDYLGWLLHASVEQLNT